MFENTGNYGKALVKYYCLAVPQMLVSAGLLTLADNLLGVTEPTLSTLVKIVIDALLFIASYFIQKTWVFKKNTAELIGEIRGWMASEHTYTIRFGIGVLMQHYLNEHFQPEYLTWAADVQSDEYYVNMMRAWYFATALAKQYEATIPLLEQQKLDTWTHNKTIQKACESFRVSDAQKHYLKTLKRQK